MKFAIIKTGGKQYRVQQGDKIKIEKINKKEGQQVTFDEVLLVKKDNQTKIGQPLIENAKVRAKVLEQGKGEKIIVFKYKPKQRYKKKKGHRQPYTQVEIKEIST